MENQKFQRLPAEILYQKELDTLIANEQYPVPPGWNMSPRSVFTYICGGRSGKLEITPKYIGNPRLVEIAIATLVTDRALLLIGEPGTAKSWLSEHLCAAINGDSTKVIQGTAAKGPSEEALVKSPLLHAMESGSLVRFEEISRCASEVQDALISILSEKRVSVPELNLEIPAQKGFSLIATANTRDKGVNEMSAALKRRFNIVVLPAPGDLKTEMDIVTQRVGQLSGALGLQAKMPDQDIVEQVVTIFRELRAGATLDGKLKVKTTSGVLSSAEAISLLANSMALAASFGDGKIRAADVAAGLQGAIVKDEAKDGVAWKDYLENILKKKGLAYYELYHACMELNK